MTKILNTLEKFVGVPSEVPVGPKTYEPSSPRVALGIAGVAMTAITIAVSVILPAQMDSGSQEPRMLAPLKANAPASTRLVAVTRVDVVALREPGSVTLPVQIGEAALQPARIGTTTLPAVVHVSSTDR
jgi:hypothetical protein